MLHVLHATYAACYMLHALCYINIACSDRCEVFEQLNDSTGVYECGDTLAALKEEKLQDLTNSSFDNIYSINSIIVVIKTFVLQMYN